MPMLVPPRQAASPHGNSDLEGGNALADSGGGDLEVPDRVCICVGPFGSLDEGGPGQLLIIGLTISERLSDGGIDFFRAQRAELGRWLKQGNPWLAQCKMEGVS